MVNTCGIISTVAGDDTFRLAVIQPERTGERGPLKLYQRAF
jgi:hypothetical protein